MLVLRRNFQNDLDQNCFKLKMNSDICVTVFCILPACFTTVRSLRNPETMEHEREMDSHKAFEKNTLHFKQENDISMKEYTPIRLSRRSTRELNARTRREVKTLVDALKVNAEKLENLTNGMNFLVQSVRGEQTGQTEIIQRMNPFFVSMFVMLTDIAFSTSPRMVTNQEDMFTVAEYFRENIMTLADKDILDKNMLSVFKWYVKSSCVDIRNAGFTQSGVYTVRVPGTYTILNVSCDQETDGGGWLLIQRRQDGSGDFFRPWADYQKGFGDISGEFWLGNDFLHLLTANVSQELRVDLMDFGGNTAYAKYSSFVVGPSTENYKLAVSGYSGTAGDALEYHDGMEFSAVDRDNDKTSGDCVANYKGGWWYNSCFHTNPNGLYMDSAQNDKKSANWWEWKRSSEALKQIEMKIRPLE